MTAASLSKYQLSALGPNGPAVGWGKVFIQDGQDNLIALDLDNGEELWRTTLWPHTGVHQPYVYDGYVYTGTGTGVPAQERHEFDAWLAHQATPAEPPDTETVQRGEQAYINAACVYCHTIEGGPGSGELGPDLTHFASRQTIGSGILENNRGNLAGWIMDPQGLKPGNYMPASDLDGHELQDLLAYLETLE